MALLSTHELQEILATSFPGQQVPIVDAVTDDGVIVRLEADGRHSRPGGTVSGPAMMTLADTAAWMAILSRIGPVLLAVTTSLHIDFLRKPAIGDLVAEAALLKLGSRLAICEVGLRGEGDSVLCAKAQVTYSIPPRA